METRVLLVDPSPILRDGIAIGLSELGRAQVVAQAPDVETALAVARATAVDVALIGLDLPARPGLEGIAALAQQLPCVVLSSVNARLTLDGALRAGARGYVVKSGDVRELDEAIRAAGEGRRHVSRAASRHLVAAFRARAGGAAGAALDALTGREREVLVGIAEGRSCPEIARALRISGRTVERHRASLMGKLDIHKTARLVRFAVREGLVSA